MLSALSAVGRCAQSIAARSLTKLINRQHAELLSDRALDWDALSLEVIPLMVCLLHQPGTAWTQGGSDGGISVYIPPKSVYLKFFLCGCFVSLTHLYPPKSNSWLRLCVAVVLNFLVGESSRLGAKSPGGEKSKGRNVLIPLISTLNLIGKWLDGKPGGNGTFRCKMSLKSTKNCDHGSDLTDRLTDWKKDVSDFPIL